MACCSAGVAIVGELARRTRTAPPSTITMATKARAFCSEGVGMARRCVGEQQLPSSNDCAPEHHDAPKREAQMATFTGSDATFTGSDATFTGTEVTAVPGCHTETPVRAVCG